MKRNSNEYRNNIRAVLLEGGVARAYFKRAPENKTFPYVVFDIRALGENRDVIEVDAWGLKGNEEELTNIADAIEENLDGYIIANEKHSSLLDSNNDMKWIDDDDENIIRINLSFNATYQA
jgi:hypothetical protein